MADKKKHDEHISSNRNFVSRSQPVPPRSPGDMTQCPHCHEHMTEMKMVKHLEHCCSWISTYKSPSSLAQTVTSVGTNQIRLPLPNNAGQISKSCPHCGNIFEEGLTQHVERCSQRLSATAPQNTERPTAYTRSDQTNNTRMNQFTGAATLCPRCGDLYNPANKRRHAEECQKVNVTFQSSNGTSGSIFYAGPNDNLIKRIRQATTTGEYNNGLDQH